MAVPVVTIAAGGLPVAHVTATKPALGVPVTEAVNGMGIPVTKVSLVVGGLPVTFVLAGNEWPAGGGGTTYATWDAATATAVTLSSGNLVVTSTTTSGDQGARVATASGKTSGKYYFEVILTTKIGGGNTGWGVGTTASTYTAMGNNATSGCQNYFNGGIWAGGVYTGITLTNPLVTGGVIGIAVDLNSRKAWFRESPSRPWNEFGGPGNGGDPAANTGGVIVPAGTIVPFCTFNASGNIFTANFGATTFTGTVPAGFTSGWPA